MRSGDNLNKYFVYAHGKYEEEGHIVGIVSAQNAEDALEQIHQKTKMQHYSLRSFPRVLVILMSELPGNFTGNQLTLRQDTRDNPYYGRPA